MNYIKVIDDLRELARDGLRLFLLSELRAERFDVELDKTRAEKELAVLKYDLEELDSNHPNYDDNKKRIEKTIESEERFLEVVNKDLIGFDKRIEEIVSGERKVSKEALTEETDELIAVYVKERVGELE